MEESFGLQDYSQGEIVRSKDPVCGAIVDEMHSAGKLEYAGEIYYFCSRDCKHRFEEDPAKFIGQLS
jgi:Cu+-exporting ATPase